MGTEAMISEHASLRAEINRYNDEIFKLENYGLAMIGLLYSWFYSQIWSNYSATDTSVHLNILLMAFPLIPFAISIGIYFRLKAYAYRTARIGMYVAELETSLEIPGWERTVWTSRFNFDPFTKEAAVEFEKIIQTKQHTAWLLPNAIKKIAEKNESSSFDGVMSKAQWRGYRSEYHHMIFALQFQGFWRNMLWFWSIISTANLALAGVIFIIVFNVS